MNHKKTCSRCGIEKPTGEFTTRRRSKDGLTASCTTCLSEYNRSPAGRGRARRSYDKDPARAIAKTTRWQSKNPERVAASARAHDLMSRYGLTVEAYEQMVLNQSGLCAICCSDNPGRGKAWCVDHCHKTGQNRGLLCFRCNTGLGYFVDDPDRLIRAAQYVDGWKEEHEH